jgi:hypothetical protein
MTHERQVDGNCSPERSTFKSSGTYRFLDRPVPSPGWSIDDLGDGDGSLISAVIDRSRGLISMPTVAYYPETVEATCHLPSIPITPDVVDQWGCGDKMYGLEGVGIEGSFTDQPTGPVTVTVDCTWEGRAFGWDDQKIVATGQLTLITH